MIRLAFRALWRAWIRGRAKTRHRSSSPNALPGKIENGNRNRIAGDRVVHDRGRPTEQDAHANRERDEHGEGQRCEVPAESDPGMNPAPKQPAYAGSAAKEGDEHQA